MTGPIARLLTALVLLVPSAAAAQSWKLIEIRKAFDGDSGEGKPANVGLVDPGPDSPAYWLLDGGIRLKPMTVHLGPSEEANQHPPRLIWYPSMEWHHMSAEPLAKQEATNSGGPALSAELWFGNPDSTTLKAYLLTKGAVTWDVLNDTTEKSASVLLGLHRVPLDASVNGGFRPGSPIKVGGRQRLIYFPYFGVEYFRQLAITSGDDTLAPIYDGGDFLAKVDFELTPFPAALPGQTRFVIGVVYEYRRLLKELEAIGTQDARFSNIDISYYFTTDRKVGIGLTLDDGRSPTVNFITQHRTALVLRVKL